MDTVVLATKNTHKVKEISAILETFGIKTKSFVDFPAMPDVIEDGATLEENSRKKALSCLDFIKENSLADDTGLEVDALNGAPGVFSARWAGENCSYGENNAKLLKELEGVSMDRRTASFVCVITLAYKDGRVFSFEGRVKGFIALNPSGKKGFGYDPVFYLPEKKMTYAELPFEEKNFISHRALALEKLKEHLRRERK